MACGSLTPENALYLGDRAYFVRATSRNLFSVGEFTLGRITGKPVVGMALPLWRRRGDWADPGRQHRSERPRDTRGVGSHSPRATPSPSWTETGG